MSDTFDEDDIFDAEAQNFLIVDSDSIMANEDVESIGSHSSTDSKNEGSQKSVSAPKFQSPVSKALQRVFRSRSSSPRITNIASKISLKRKGSPNRSEGSLESSTNFHVKSRADNNSDYAQKEESDCEATEVDGYSISDQPASSMLYEDSYDSRDAIIRDRDYDEVFSDSEDNGWFSPSERISLTPPPTLRKLSRNSLAQIHSLSAHDMSSEFKPMVTSRSFSCLQNSLSKVTKGEFPNSLIQKASEEYFKSGKSKRKKFNSATYSKLSNKERNCREVPKVFVSIDDDHPCSPEEERRFPNNFLQDSSEFYETVIINSDDGLPHTEKQSEEELSDREITPRKVKSVLKTLSLWKMNRAAGGQSPEPPRMRKQFSIDSDSVHHNGMDESVQLANNLFIPENSSSTDSRLKVLKKLTLSLQGKDKLKGQDSTSTTMKFSSEVNNDLSVNDLPVKGLLNNSINSSEESIPLSILEKNTRKGKFRELSNFLIKENSAHHLRNRKSHEDTFDDVHDPSSYSVSEMSIKNSKSFGEKVAEYLQRGGSRLQEQQRRLKSQIWSSVVTIVLIEGKDLPAMDRAGSSDPYVKFRLGNEKYKSKVEFRSLNPRWLEQFDFHLFEDQSQLLEITVWDKDPRAKDECVGRCTLDMRNYERENTHEIWAELEGESELHEGKCGKLFLLLTISGTTSTASISDLISHKENPNEIRATKDRYKVSRTFHNLRDVGMLIVKIFKAQGLAAADFGVGKSDPFCVLELVNSRLQTQTEYKTLSPSWNKIFTL